MGALTPALLAASALDLIGQRRQERAREQADALAATARDHATADTLARLDQQQARDDAGRQDRLRRAAAATRASFAGRGIGAGSASAASVLAGLLRADAEEGAADHAAYDLARRSAETERSLSAARDLLARSAERERERLRLLGRSGGRFLDLDQGR